MLQDLARVICLIDVRFDKAASDWITLQEENWRAARDKGPTSPDQKTKRTTLRKSKKTRFGELPRRIIFIVDYLRFF